MKKLRVEYFQEQINLIRTVYLLLGQSYDYLSKFNPQSTDEQNGVDQLSNIKKALEKHEDLVKTLQEKLEKLKQTKDNKAAFNSLGAEIGMQVEKLLIDIIDLSCPSSSKEELKKQYSMLTGKTFSALKHEEDSVIAVFTSTLTGSPTIKHFKKEVKEYIDTLTKAIQQKQKIIEKELPLELQNELAIIRVGNFSKLPGDITAYITSFLTKTDVCRLSETGQFFRKITANSRTQWKNAFEKSLTKIEQTLPKISVNLIGDSMIGIRSLICRLAENKFIDSNLAKIVKSHVQYDKKHGRFMVHYASPLVQGRDYPREHNMNRYYEAQYKGDKIHLLCFDISSRESFTHLRAWYDEVARYNQYNPSARFLIVGLKSDTASERQVNKEEAEELARSFGTVYIETSAKENKGIDALKAQIIETYSKSHKPEQQTSVMQNR